jgi:hypothetical protein
MSSSFMKRLEALEQKISFRRPRQIVVLVDGNNEDHSAADAIVRELAPGPDDLVIYLRRFGGDDLGLPRLLSVRPL